jgi:hypothetical protein
MSELLTLFRTRPRNPSAGSLKDGTLRSPASTQLNGLQVYYPLEETSGLRRDFIGGGLGAAAQFTRANTEFFSLTNANSPDLTPAAGDMTVCGWFYLDSLVGPTAEQNIASRFLSTGNKREWRAFVNTANTLSFQVSALGTSASITTVTDPTLLVTATWYFWTAWKQGTILGVSLNAGASTLAAGPATVFSDLASAVTFRIGNIGAGTSANCFDGRMQAMAYFSSALSADAIASLYNAGRGRRYETLTVAEKSTNVAWWPMNEYSPETGAVTRADSAAVPHTALSDSASRVGTAQGIAGNSLTDVNTVTSNTGKVGTAAEFTLANSEQLVAPDSVELRSTDTDWAFSFWVYLAATATNQTIFSKDNGAAAGREYRLDFLTATGKMTWIVYDGTTAIGTVVSTQVFSATTFYHIRVYHSATDNLVGLQVNGGTADEAATSGAASSGTAIPFRLGANGSGTPQAFGGRIDEFGRWNRLRTAGEIAADYNAGSGLAFPKGGSSVL